ncbi:MAG: O-antigen ligase family protein [Lachnospiraceae bacterium]|nr:O-antigen ligase family protein [Lachnospiraceae bacterium]
MSLREWLDWLKVFLRERYVIVSLLVLGIFIFPDYTAPGFAMAALVAAAGEKKKTGRKIFSLAVSGKFLLIFIADLAVTIIYSMSRVSSLLTVLMWLSMFSIYYALRAVITDSERFRRLMQLLTLCVGLLGLISCLQYIACAVLDMDYKYLHFWWFLDDAVSHFFPLRSFTDDMRSASTFMNPNIFAEVMVCLLPLCYYAVGKARHDGTKNLFVICILIGTLGTAFSFSRASYFCMFCLLVLTVIFIVKRMTKHQARLFISVVVIAGLLVLFTPNIFMDRIMKLHTGDASVKDHILEWKSAFRAISHRLIMGYGVGSAVSKQVMSSYGLQVLHSHNLYLELLLEGGIPALLTFAAPTVICLKNQICEMYKKRKNNLLGFCMFSAVFMFLIFGLSDYPLLTPGLIGSFILLMTLSDISMDLFS